MEEAIKHPAAAWESQWEVRGVGVEGAKTDWFDINDIDNLPPMFNSVLVGIPGKLYTYTIVRRWTGCNWGAAMLVCPDDPRKCFEWLTSLDRAPSFTFTHWTALPGGQK